MDRIFVAAGTSVVVHLNGPCIMDMVEDGISGRQKPFLLVDEPAPQRRIVVAKGEKWSGRVFNTVSGAAGAPVDAVVRVLPPGADYERWEGQVGQIQLLNLVGNIGGQYTFDQDDVIIPPDAEGMRVSWEGTVDDAYISGGTFTFANNIRVLIPGVANGISHFPLYDRTFTFLCDTILNDGSGAGGASTMPVIVSFTSEPPVKSYHSDFITEFADEDNIAQATTYYFQVPFLYQDKHKRLTCKFVYDYEDDANTAGGNVLFFSDGYGVLPAASGAAADITWPFPLGVDVGADRRGSQCLNAVVPEYRTYLAIQNSDAAKDIDNWLLSLHGVDEQ